MLTISVIIPSYNSEKTIRQCIDSLLNQSVKPLEIIIADSSDDHTPAIIKKEYPTCKLIHFPKKTDPGTARNKAIKISTGDIIACIDSDCVADNNWLKNIREMHENNPTVSAIGGSVIPANDKNDRIGWAGYMAEFREYLPIHKASYVRHIPTCNISYKKSVFEGNRGFNPMYYPQEDMIFNFQITSNGGKILFSPEILVKHYHRSELKNFFQHQKKIGKITAQLIYKFELKGYFVTKFFPFTLPIIPLLALVKWINTIVAFRKMLFSYPVILSSLPYFTVGLYFWLNGFLIGTIRKL
ncbi:MAG: glycosyltransferase family 2 protein [Calditrichia bacterium]